EFRNRVDIFDAGPVLQCAFGDIRAIRDSQRAEVSALIEAEDERAETLVCNERLKFCACPAVVRDGPGGTVELSRAVGEALDIRPGQPVRFVPIRADEAPRSHDV